MAADMLIAGLLQVGERCDGTRSVRGAVTPRVTPPNDPRGVLRCRTGRCARTSSYTWPCVPRADIAMST